MDKKPRFSFAWHSQKWFQVQVIPATTNSKCKQKQLHLLTKTQLLNACEESLNALKFILWHLWHILYILVTWTAWVSLFFWPQTLFLTPNPEPNQHFSVPPFLSDKFRDHQLLLVKGCISERECLSVVSGKGTHHRNFERWSYWVKWVSVLSSTDYNVIWKSVTMEREKEICRVPEAT